MEPPGSPPSASLKPVPGEVVSALEMLAKHQSVTVSAYQDLEEQAEPLKQPASLPSSSTSAGSGSAQSAKRKEWQLRRPRIHRGRTLLSSLLYLVGSMLYLAASIVILPYLELDSYSSDVMYLIGSIAYWVAAVVDVWDSHKSLQVDPVAPPPDLPCHRLPTKVETLVLCCVFLLGATLFTLGSILYMPQLNLPGYYGTLVFRAGSCTYISGSLYGLMLIFFPHVSTSAPINPWAVATKLQYMTGSSLFITGGQMFIKSDYLTGAIIWVIGSVLFTTGSLTGLYLTYQSLPASIALRSSPRVSTSTRPRFDHMLLASSYAVREG